MDDLGSANRTRAPAAQDMARLFEVLATLLILIIIVGVLFVAREILVPVAIAILLSFVLSPLVKLLRGLGLGKGLSVGAVVLAAFLTSVGIGVIMGTEVSDLAADAPRFQSTVTQKIEDARVVLSNSAVLRKASQALSDVAHLPGPPPPPAEAARTMGAGTAGGLATRPAEAQTTPTRVTIVAPSLGLFDILQKVVGAAASPLAAAAFVAIFIVFILMQREDLRNRFIRLVGSGDIQRTTLAMNDAARRLSRYLLAQVLINTGFGVVVAVALSVIGVPSAILWGIFSILMRFIPYIGAIGAAFFPVLLAAAAGTGWSMAIETAVFFVVIEAVVGQMIEPMVYGHNTGISPLAVVLSAVFWTWLWGPVGLVLSTPLTVCLVVIGRHVESLSFLDVIFGDAPPLTPVESFYQRVLAGDASEIADHAERYLKEQTLLEYCDGVAMQALLLAQNDVRRGRLEHERLTIIKDTVDELVEDLFDRDFDRNGISVVSKQSEQAPVVAIANPDETSHPVPSDGLPPAPGIAEAWRHPRAVLCIGGRTPLDEAAAQLLAAILGKYGLGAYVEPATVLASAALPSLAEPGAQLVILSFLDADLSIPQARFAVRRLRRRVPGVPIVAAFWTEFNDGSRSLGLCSDVKSDLCVSHLEEALTLCLERASIKAVEIAA